MRLLLTLLVYAALAAHVCAQDFPILMRDTTQGITSRSDATLTPGGTLRNVPTAEIDATITETVSSPPGSPLALQPAAGQGLNLGGSTGPNVAYEDPAIPGAFQLPYARLVPSSLPPTLTSTPAGAK